MVNGIGSPNSYIANQIPMAPGQQFTNEEMSPPGQLVTVTVVGAGESNKKETQQQFDRTPPPGQVVTVTVGPGESSKKGTRFDKLYSQFDSNGDKGIDKTEFAAMANRLADKAGSAVNVNDVFSAYDANNDGKLSKAEFRNFIKHTNPRLLAQKQSSSVGYGDQNSVQISSLTESLQKNTAADSTAAGSTTPSVRFNSPAINIIA